MSDPGVTGSSLNIVQQLQRHKGDFVPDLPFCKKHHLKLQQAQVSVPWHVSARAMPLRLCTAPLIPPPRLSRAQPVLSSPPAPHTASPQPFPGRQRRRCPGRGPAPPGHATACPPGAGGGIPAPFRYVRMKGNPRWAPAFSSSLRPCVCKPLLPPTREEPGSTVSPRTEPRSSVPRRTEPRRRDDARPDPAQSRASRRSCRYRRAKGTGGDGTGQGRDGTGHNVVRLGTAARLQHRMGGQRPARLPTPVWRREGCSSLGVEGTEGAEWGVLHDEEMVKNWTKGAVLWGWH